MKTTPVVCRNLSKSFGDQTVVDDVSFSVPAGQILALLGPSGCGKTTTLRLIAGFEQADAGVILIEGQEVANGRIQLPPEKRRVGMVFQDYAIFPHLSVAENVAFGLPRGKERASQVETMLDFVGLGGLGARMPHELSGGQQQRVALARALAPKPAVLLLDEPFSNLDAALRTAVRQEVKELLKASGTTAVFVTHDQEEALFLGDQVAVMNGGRLEQIGAAEVVFHEPKTRFVAEFMGHTDFIGGSATSTGVDTSLGFMPLAHHLPAGAAVEVVVRPDDVKLEDAEDGTGNGRILSRQFLGIAYLYRVALPDGRVVQSWQPHQINFPIGTAVQASIRPGHVLRCFAGETAV
ncbi:MAG: ABC transporter ATP-binding protein [Chloroflexi bacterium]|nr:ABC transporter ATP-binding protein [Chloroflexota bacterium]MBP7593550.1 ABC transporter ATP-binding protein [Chloroflexota bacterium]